MKQRELICVSIKINVAFIFYFYSMQSKLRDLAIERINRSTITQTARNQSLQVNSDVDQNNSLSNRSNIIKNNYHYLFKIDKAEQMIKEARHINFQRINEIKNGSHIKNLIKKQPSEQSKICQKEQFSTIKTKNNLMNEVRIRSKMNRKSESNNSNDSKINTMMNKISYINRNTIQVGDKTEFKQIVQGSINKSIINIDHSIVSNYFKDKMNIFDETTTPQKIYKIINPFYQLCGVKISLPLIKKYKNCTYFGDSSKNQQAKYQGFIIFHEEEKLYYGELQNQKKNGRGTQIDFKSNTVYIGIFSKGRKTGEFTVLKPNQKYVGQLYKGLYQGYGQLTTDLSIYKGFFDNGQRNGEGQEKFLLMGLTICGTFVNNKFTNSSSKPDQLSSNKKEPFFEQNSLNSSLNRSLNPQKKRVFEDDNVIFEQSTPSKQIFQVFDCDFMGEVEQMDDFEEMKIQKAPAFRIKQLKEIPKCITQRRRIPSQQKSMFSTTGR